MKFEQLGLAEPILRAVATEGYATPTPIQVKAIPHVLEGSDLLGCAQTGTGKTAAFALPILHRLIAKTAFAPAVAHAPRAESQHAGNGHARNGHAKPHTTHPSRSIRALILCPTRELASQIGESFRVYGKHTHLKHVTIFGGVNQFHQVRSLKSGVDILVATPGRLLDLMNQGYVDLKAIEVFVLDEADRMLDMGFIPDIRRIVKQIPSKRQTLLFSATMPADIRALADSILHKPVSVQVSPVSSTVQTVAQSVYFVPRQSKPALLAHMLKSGDMQRTLVFTRTKRGADKVVTALTRAGIRAEAIHGNKSQNARTRALDQFKSKAPPVLVATDIASRGIDVDGITHVVNFDMPDVPETYVHRIGRTARAGASGIAVSFCDHEERGDLKAIERLTRANIQVLRDLPALEAAPARERNGFAEPQDAGDHPRPHRGHKHGEGHRSPAKATHARPNRHPTAPAAHGGKHASHASHAPRQDRPAAQHAHGQPTASRGKGFAQRGRGKGRAGQRPR